jgi:hypothetical protein
MMSPTPEIWLRTNRRALWVALVVTLLVAAAVVAGAVVFASQGEGRAYLLFLAGLFAGGCLLFVAALLYQMNLPRLAYASGELWVYLESATPTRVPIDIVEFFFVGQGSSQLPAADDAPAKSRTVVVRLAESAIEWHDRTVKPQWGEWREGYIILRGTWCEPLNPEVLNRLNRRLREVKQEHATVQDGAS